MTELAAWLQAKMQERGYTQIQTAVHTDIAQGTISDILNKGHIPRMEGLFRLADHFGTSRVDILILAGHLQRGDQMPRGEKPQPDSRDYLINELVETFRQIPDAWKPEVINQARIFLRLANHPSVRIIGQEEDVPQEDPKE